MKRLIKVFTIATITAASTLFFGWLSTAVNTTTNIDAAPSWFSFTCAILSMVALVGGCFLTIEVYEGNFE